MTTRRPGAFVNASPSPVIVVCAGIESTMVEVVVAPSAIV
jgi:hypothetical protein